MNAQLRTLSRRWLLAFSICLMAATVFAQSLEVIELKHRTAQELIPALRPLIAPGGALSGQDYTLFVRTSPGNLAEIRKVVAQLDRQQRQLLVSVRTATRQEIEREGVAVSGELSTQGARARVSGVDSNAQADRGGVASVAVLEGNSALIDNGSSVPIVTAVIGAGGRRPWLGAQTEYRDLPNGFVVTPRVSGETVILDIQQRSDALRGGHIETQQVQTQVSGRLGEWIPLGGVTSSSVTRQHGIGGRSYSTLSDDRNVWVKVETQ
jgi:type II secretory pathway component GspD/PulD (secretin)